MSKKLIEAAVELMSEGEKAVREKHSKLPLDQLSIRRAVGLAILKNPKVKAIVATNFEQETVKEFNSFVEYKKAITSSLQPRS